MIELGSQLHTVSALQDCKHWKGTYNLSKWTSDAYTYSSTLKSYKYFKDSTRLLWLIEKLSSRKLPPRSDWPKRWPQRQVPRPTRLALQGQRCCIYLNCSRSCSSYRWHCCIQRKLRLQCTKPWLNSLELPSHICPLPWNIWVPTGLWNPRPVD